MVNYQPDSLTTVFSALADPTRRAIVERLAQGESRVSDLAEPFDVSLPAISKHLRVLEQAGLLGRDIEGRTHRCRLDAKPMQEVAEWVDRYRRFWEAQFDALAKYLGETRRENKRCLKKETAPKQFSKFGERSQRRGRRFSAPGRQRKC